MSNLVKISHAHVIRIIFYQTLIIMGFTLIMICIKGVQSGISALAGAFSYALPTSLFLWRLSSHAGATALTRFMLTFFIGEALKLIVCGFSFLIFIKYYHMNLIDAFFGLSVAIIAFWISSVMSIYSKGAKS